MNKAKCRLKKDDKVKVISGKEKGKIGKVLKIYHKKNRILIENINKVKKHEKPTDKSAGGIVDKEAPVHWSNVMLMCSKCFAPVRIKFQYQDDNKKVRVCRKCNDFIDS